MSADVASGLARDDWQRRYARRLIVTDFLAVVWAVIGVQLVWLGTEDAAATFTNLPSRTDVGYTFISLGVIALWMLILAASGSRGPRVIGVGATEYRIILDWGLRLLALAAATFFFLKLDVARGYVLLVYPVGVIALLASRWLWRQWLRVEREHGRFTAKVVLVGPRSSVQHYAQELARQPWAGYRVVAACVPGEAFGTDATIAGVDIRGGLNDVPLVLQESGGDTVLVAGAGELSPQDLRQLSWKLEAGKYHLVVAPNLTDIGGPRIHTRPVPGLPLIHVETPRYEGVKRYSKRIFDIVASSFILIALALPLLLAALTVKLSSPGPIFYRQERVGLKGKTFGMIKFRSMIPNADALLAELLQKQGTENRPLFKVSDDPRVTKTGRFMRKYSIDELPQIFNVLKGDMSLVGPRPQRPAEVALYDNAASRRLIVQPGMTGLWQVSGRSSLSWEDAIRLDLYYVENWSLTGDLVILWRTAKAVVVPGHDAF